MLLQSRDPFRLDVEFSRLACHQVFLSRVGFEPVRVLDEVVDHRGVVATCGEGQGDLFLCRVVYDTILVLLGFYCLFYRRLPHSLPRAGKELYVYV